MQSQKNEAMVMIENLKNKASELDLFLSDISATMKNISSSYKSAYKDMNHEFNKLIESLEAKRNEFLQKVENEEAKKYGKLQNQLDKSEETYKELLELIKDSENTLTISDQKKFDQEMLIIKERITMSPAFRVSMIPSVSDSQCWLAVDFSTQKKLIEKLDFLKAPSKPIICEDYCRVSDNQLYCEWKMPESDENEEEEAEHFNFQYRQVDSDQINQITSWRTVTALTCKACLIEDLILNHNFIQFRCQAQNKFIPGEYSDVVNIKTQTFHFQLDATASHPNLKLVSPLQVEWEAAAIKAENRTRPSTAETRGSPKRIKPKDRFTGESYTILGDSDVPDDVEIYFEVMAQVESKIFGCGLTVNSIGRYDQLGRTSGSWALFVNKWIQNSIVAKHNKKIKTLERSSFPLLVGIHYNPFECILSFYDGNTKECLHSFKNVKKPASSQFLVGLSVWNGGLKVKTGLQVPSWVKTHSTKSTIASSKSEDNSICEG